MKFDGRHSTGNRYYVGLMNMELAGLHGNDKMIYVMEPSCLKLTALLNCYDPAHIILNSVPIAKASPMLKGDVIRQIAYNEVGISRSIPVILEPLSGGKVNYGETKHNITKNKRTGEILSVDGVQKIIINPYSENMDRSQYYDIYLNLVHEKHHADTPEDVGDEIESEYYAYREVRFHHYFKYASEDYQRHVNNRFDDYEKLFLARR